MAKIILLGHNSETHCLTSLSDWIQLHSQTTPNFGLYYIDLATLLTHIPYSYPYTRDTMQYNQYKHARHTSAMRYSHARGLTAYSYTIQC